MSVDVVRVGIAVVEQDSRYLVGVRSPETVLAGKAEFPGGKCLTEESPLACAVRECLEESGLQVAAVSILAELTHTYPHATVELTFVLCRPAPEGQIPLHGFRWVERTALAGLDFPEANRVVVNALLANSQD